MDGFHDPQPQQAASKETVNLVLDHVVRAGNSLLSLLSGLLAAALILFSGYVLYDTAYTQSAAASSSFELLRYRPDIIDNGAAPVSGEEELAAINDDYRAWLTLYDTSIDYPVMQAEDDTYYAMYDIYGNQSFTGAIYLAAANSADLSDSYNLIFGHHMENGAMFGGIDHFLDESYFNSHREGVIVSPSGIYDLRLFAAAETDAYEPEIYSVGDRMDEVADFLRARYAESDGRTMVFIFDESALNGAERIVALSTCKSVGTNERRVVFATMTRRNMLTLEASGYSGVYDGASHGPARVKPNYTEGTKLYYSTDGGASWTEGLPSIKDVGEQSFLLRAENEIYGTATASVTLKVEPKALTIKVSDAFKIYGDKDPAWSVETITGIVDGFKPVYTIRRSNAGVEDVGTYRGVLVAEGAARQGNYLITFAPGDFTITAKDALALLAEGYNGVYDAQEHGPERIQVNIPDGTLIEYSTDGGLTWSTRAPTIRDVGTLRVTVRASNPNYVSATASFVLQIAPATVTVTAQDAVKPGGEKDPEFTAEITGLVDDQQIVYTISRPGAGEDEAPGRHEGAIVPAGEEFQGNYRVVYVAGDLIVTESAKPAPADRPEKPGRRAWALVNLICLIVTAYIFLPLLHLRDKYGRVSDMRKFNREKCALRDAAELSEEQESERGRILEAAREEMRAAGAESEDREPTEKEFAAAVEKLYYRVTRIAKRFRLGSLLELVTVVAAIIAFVLTEDMRLPMIFVDKWTPLMILLMALCWVLDIRLLRSRKEDRAEAEEKDTAGAVN